MGWDVRKRKSSGRIRRSGMSVATGVAAVLALVAPFAPVVTTAAWADVTVPPAAGKPLPRSQQGKANAEIEGGCSVPDKHDPKVTKEVYRVGLTKKATDKVMLAAFEAGWIESHMNNITCGDRDSLGVFQQRPSQGWGTREQVTNVTYAATKFFDEAQKNERRKASSTAGQLAQSVQNSAYPERYDQSRTVAEDMISEAKQATKPSEALAFRDLSGVGDMTGDGVPDMVALDTRDKGGQLMLFPGVVGGGFGARKSLATEWNGMREVVGIGALGPDAKPDVLAVQKSSGKLFRWAGQSWRSTLGAGKVASQDNWTDMTRLSAAGDVTGDRLPDLFAVEGKTGKLYLFPGATDGSFGHRRAVGTAKTVTWLSGVGDLNYDGVVDQISVDKDGKVELYPGKVRDKSMLGDVKGLKLAGKQLREVTGFGDFDGDKVPDLLAIDTSNGELKLSSGSRTDGGNLGDGKTISTGWK